MEIELKACMVGDFDDECRNKKLIYELQSKLGSALEDAETWRCEAANWSAEANLDSKYRAELKAEYESRLETVLDNQRILLERIAEKTSRLDSALAELRQCYKDDGCTPQEVEDQLTRFVERPSPAETNHE